MSSEIRLWKIEADTPKPIDQSKLNLEDRLENWMAQDIGMVNDDLLVIGRQVETAHGGKIDLLAIDINGNLVILELKRDRTPRDVVAQTLDYASWVQDLEYKDIEEIAGNFLGDDRTLGQAFKENFDADLPENMNISHRMYIVASSLDSATERIVEYLSETHDVDINVATFSYFQTTTGDELLGRTFLLDDAEVQRRAEFRNAGRKRRRSATFEELREMAQEHGVAELWDKAIDGLRPMASSTQRSQTTLSFYVRVRDGNRTAFSLVPNWSSSEEGLVIRLRDKVVSEHFGVSEDEVQHACGPDLRSAPGEASKYPWNNDMWGGERFFDDEKLDKFIKFLRNAKQRQT